MHLQIFNEIWNFMVRGGPLLGIYFYQPPASSFELDLHLYILFWAQNASEKYMYSKNNPNIRAIKTASTAIFWRKRKHGKKALSFRKLYVLISCNLQIYQNSSLNSKRRWNNSTIAF